MKKLLILLLVPLFLQCTPKSKAPQQPIKEVITEQKVTPIQFNKEKLDAYLKSLYENKKWMGGVALMQDGKLIYTNNFGPLAEGSTLQANQQTKYRIGSVTKMFTAVLIYQLIEEGKLSLNEPLSTFYPNVKNADKITIKHLLGHESGIQNYTSTTKVEFTREYTKSEMLDLITQMETVFKPGSEKKYSNSNYILLGFIVEDLYKMPIAKAYQQQILSKGKLTKEITFEQPTDIKENYTHSYKWNHKNNDWEEVKPWGRTVAGSAGAISSSMESLAEFLYKWYEGDYLTDASLQQMTSIEKSMGYGSFLVPFHDKTSYGHGGGIEEFSTMASYFPKEKISFAIVSNASEINTNDVSIGVLSILFGKEFELPTFEKKNSIKGNSYLGTFSNSKIGLEIEVTQQGEDYYAQATGQGKFKLDQEENVFTQDAYGIKMVFDGYDRFVLYQGGGEFTFSRIK